MKYHLYIPLMVLILIAVRGTWDYELSEIVLFLPLFVFFCLPYLIVIGVGKLIKSKNESIHSILIGVHAALIITYMVVSADGTNSAGNGWVFYYPLSIILVLIISILAKHESKKRA
jgi:hypothetical protein